MSLSLLLVIPPLTQLNTPYPSTAYLSGFLRAQGYVVESERASVSPRGPGLVYQADLGIEMVLALFSRPGLMRLFEEVRGLRGELPGEARQMLALERAYLDSIDAVIGFLQGKDQALAPRICHGSLLPQGPRFSAALQNTRASSLDQARHLATLYLEDLADLVRETVAPQFALSRYAEHVGTSASTFAPIQQALAAMPSLTDELMLEALCRHLDDVQPEVVGLTVPFPGNLYGALRVAQAVKTWRPVVHIVLGGGYANTELRRVTDPRIFDLVDYVTLDDGERPLLCLLEHLASKRDEHELCRTFLRSQGKVVWRNGARDPEFSMAELGTPTYAGLFLDRYISVLDSLNPMHRLWSDGHWNKLTVAHGCYWKQCTFCDVDLDYIGRYEAAPSEILADRIDTLIAETGRRGFHFVDEAAPPAGLKGLALCLLERGSTISWWGNIRFEAAFTADLCRLLAASGCIAITAGLEAASDRLLAQMKKGITVGQAARVAAAFQAAGILVHAYLMYGLPGETVEETIESLERVRQLFAHNLLQSAFWHKFVATAHSPIGLNPSAHGITITGPAFQGFAENDLTHEGPGEATPDWLGEGLRTALYHYKEGEGFQADVRSWFERSLKRPRVQGDWVERALAGNREEDDPNLERHFVWIGGEPVLEKEGRALCRMILPNRMEDVELRLPVDKALWLIDLIHTATPKRDKRGERYPNLQKVRAAYPLGGSRRFDLLLRSASWRKIREIGLLLV